VTSHATPSQDDALRAEPPLNIAPVEEMLRLLSRAVRARLLYLENNPTYHKALETLKASFSPIWAHADELVFEITDTQILSDGHAVITEAEKTADALPWILYKDGLRELTFARGVEHQEIVDLVQVVAKVRKGGSEDDLLTLLWELEFSYVKYRSAACSCSICRVIRGHGQAQRVKMMSATQTWPRKSASVSTRPSWLVSAKSATWLMTGNGGAASAGLRRDRTKARQRMTTIRPTPIQIERERRSVVLWSIT
jgi:hypothetical protein